MTVLSKSQFAVHIGVVPSRITAMIKAGIIGEDAIEGAGRNARIKVELAVEQIRSRRHVGQAVGNGWRTRLGRPEGSSAYDQRDDVGLQLQAERLVKLRRENAQAEERYQRDNQRLVPASEVDRLVAITTDRITAIVDGWPEDIARAVSRQFEIPSDDALVAVRRVFAKIPRGEL